ncbi:hypothetical protein TSAR_011103 [Trichomalopsis sarcophagae]|uniref:HAT C-terminal dimerisation domain-containing protein n=1 Tax=Trichomalopsis sarcophagae TaxID=543379 RepID=A0A232F0H5_9HYME|nr:hypothetical protein TSAR_011103 [Trichomalopsis sarcophagae]
MTIVISDGRYRYFVSIFYRTHAQYYLNQPTIGMDENPIEYWNKNSSSLFTLAKRYPVIVATSVVPSESLFSKARRIMTQDRSRLSPKHLQHLLFLASLQKKKRLAPLRG